MRQGAVFLEAVGLT